MAAEPNPPQRKPYVPFDIWERGGITEHMGGVFASRRLVDACRVAPGQTVLDIGCGTGYTACHLAQHYRARVVALDISPRVVEAARQRASKAGLGKQVRIVRGDAHHLPFPDGAFDSVIMESVMVFCDSLRLCSEIYRALRPGGMLGDNELTLLAPPPDDLRALLATMGIHPRQAHEWQEIYVTAGFVDVTASVRRISFGEQLLSHLKVDGLLGYIAAAIRGLSDSGIRRTFFNREMLRAARQFLPYVGYGLYVGRKAEDASRAGDEP